MVVADDLAPIRRQGICNHHVNMRWSVSSHLISVVSKHNVRVLYAVYDTLCMVEYKLTVYGEFIFYYYIVASAPSCNTL